MIALGLTLLCSTAGLAMPADTVRLEVGSPEVNGLVYAPHAARVRVWVGPGQGRKRAEWTNVLTLGDSAGRRIQRWVTTGTSLAANGDTVQWELRQTYDARTLAPYGIVRTTSTGAQSALRIDGKRVTGTRRAAREGPVEQVDLTVAQPGFVASASDLVPLAAGLQKGKVMIAPVWGPGMPASELRVFSVTGQETVDVEGTAILAWKVEERRRQDRKLLATWYLVDRSPYMVYGEVPQPDGTIQRYTEVEIPMPGPRPEDVASVDGVIAALYEVISGPAGQPRNWDRFRGLFAPGARLIPTGRRPDGSHLMRVLTPDDYAANIGPRLETDGFFEKEIGRVTETYGGIVHAMSAYESFRTAADTVPFSRGINSIQLVNDGKRWWVLTILWEAERPDNPIPGRFLRKP